ncbi:MAG: EH signature domain-containing protein [Bacteroidales bacterium]|nr:EH signature domain-containing protein [Bacteroidales bacterium]
MSAEGQDIYSLLDIDIASIQEFHLRANMLENRVNARAIDVTATRLRKIEDSFLLSDKPLTVPQETIEAAIKKLRSSLTSNTKKLEARELRILCYNVALIHEEQDLVDQLIKLVDANWRNLYFNGLVYYMFAHWVSAPMVIRNKVCQLIMKKLTGYQGSIKRYVALQNLSNLFEENGPLRMAMLVKARNISLQESPTILGYRPSAFLHSYYDEVIIQYVKLNPDLQYSDIEQMLDDHQSSRCNKLVCCDLILAEERSNDALKQQQVALLARRMLGDLTLSTTWAPFREATPIEIEKLEKANLIVNQWYARRVIETFFEVVCHDQSDRKAFWLNYINYIDGGFRIAGSKAVRTTLQSDSRVSGLLSRIFIETSSTTLSTAALILYIRNKVIVEFSDVGCVYVYRPNDPIVAPLKNRKSIESLSGLKNLDLGNLVSTDYYGKRLQETGYLRHAQNWQERLRYWINKKLIVPNESSRVDISQSIPVCTIPEKTAIPSSSQPSLFTGRDVKTAASKDNVKTSKPKTTGRTTKDTKKKSTSPQLSGFSFKEEYSFKKKSKTIFDGHCQLMATPKGLHLINLKTNRDKLLVQRDFADMPDVQVWVKKENLRGYQAIVCHTEKEDIPMGSIKWRNDSIFFNHPEGKFVMISLSSI